VASGLIPVLVNQFSVLERPRVKQFFGNFYYNLSKNADIFLGQPHMWPKPYCFVIYFFIYTWSPEIN
jgi:hypothetical protein